jgi:hypothetical protein
VLCIYEAMLSAEIMLPVVFREVSGGNENRKLFCSVIVGCGVLQKLAVAFTYVNMKG